MRDSAWHYLMYIVGMRFESIIFAFSVQFVLGSQGVVGFTNHDDSFGIHHSAAKHMWIVREDDFDI